MQQSVFDRLQLDPSLLLAGFERGITMELDERGAMLVPLIDPGSGSGSKLVSSLVIGALIALRFQLSPRVIALIMAFGGGVLISAVAFDLVE